MNSLAISYHRVGQNEEAIKLLEKTLELNKVMFGNSHSDTLSTSFNLSSVYHDLGRDTDAVSSSKRPWHWEKLILAPITSARSIL